MATCQTEVSADGFDIIRLRSPRLSVSVMPQRDLTPEAAAKRLRSEVPIQ